MPPLSDALSYDPTALQAPPDLAGLAGIVQGQDRQQPAPAGAHQFSAANPPPPMPPPQPLPGPAPVGVPYPGAAQATPAGPQLAARPSPAGPQGWVPGSRETKAGPFTPQAATAALNTVEPQVNLLQAQAGAEGAHNAAAAQAAPIDLAMARSQEISQRLLMQQHQSQLSDYAQRVDNLQKEASSANIDPQRFFHNMGAPQKILTLIGTVIGTFGQAFTGKGPSPLEMVSRLIEQDIHAQEATLANKRAGAQAGELGLARMQKLFGDQESAKMALDVQDRSWLQAQLQQQAANATAPYDQRLRAAQLSADVSKSIADTVAKLDDRTTGKMTESYRQATTGGQQLGATVMVGGKPTFVPIAQLKELQGAGLAPAAPKEAAETRKTEAEATAAEAKAQGAATNPEVKALAEVGRSLQSTDWQAVQRNIQGTDAQKALRAQQDWNARLISVYHSTHPGIRLTVELIDKALGAYMVHPGMTQTTIEDAIRRGVSAVSGTAPSDESITAPGAKPEDE